MGKERVTAFTDAVIAIALTILVLELKEPQTTTWQSLWRINSTFIPYTISFLILAVFWNNHHHLFQIVRKINGNILWANNILIFFLSLFPWVTKFVENNLTSVVPETIYGLIYIFMSSSYFVLCYELTKADPKNKNLHFIVRRPMRIIFNLGIMLISLIIGNIYWPPIIIITSLLLILTWLIPDISVENIYR